MFNATPARLESFIPVAPDSHFPIQNLPLGVFRRRDDGRPRLGVAIGEEVLDLAAVQRAGLLTGLPDGEALSGCFERASLNALMGLGRGTRQALRRRITELLGRDEPRLRDDDALRREALVRQSDVEMLLPVEIGDYTDFYSSREHATHCGTLFRGRENPLTPNWLHLPVAYHGRASSVVVSGTDLHRPWGQSKADDAAAPSFGPSQAVDFELEMGHIIGPGNALGEPISVEAAAEHVFGMVLVNDWSARDLQKWEAQPLGPFLSKSFGTSISPWVVTLEALEPFRTAGPVQDPPPLPYLRSSCDWAFDIHLEVRLQSATMAEPMVVCASNYRYLYWNICQQVAHHTVAGCNLRGGDLLASGTISGADAESLGCLLEKTHGGRVPFQLPGGETRTWLADGDRVTMTAWCQGPGYRVGFGEVTGRLLPAKPAAG